VENASRHVHAARILLDGALDELADFGDASTKAMALAISWRLRPMISP